MCVPVRDCCISNVLIQFVQNCQDMYAVTVNSVSKVGKFSNIACSIISCLVMGNFVPKNSIVTKFCQLVLGHLVIMPYHVHW